MSVGIGRVVYGVVSSPPTIRVLASLYEHDLDFDFVAIDINADEHEKEPFLSLSPFGQIPAFQDGDLTLFESRTIMRYIAFNYPKPGNEHIFKDPLIQGVAAVWIDVEDHQFNPPASKLIDEFIFKPSKNDFVFDQTGAVIVLKEELQLAKVLDVYEERLKESKYLGGDKFTSADLSHLPCLHYLMKTPLMKKLVHTRPHVCSWCENIMSRPAWLKVVKFMEINQA